MDVSHGFGNAVLSQMNNPCLAGKAVMFLQAYVNFMITL